MQKFVLSMYTSPPEDGGLRLDVRLVCHVCFPPSLPYRRRLAVSSTVSLCYNMPLCSQYGSDGLLKGRSCVIHLSSTLSVV
jgi:hypothetical protein